MSKSEVAVKETSTNIVQFDRDTIKRGIKVAKTANPATGGMDDRMQCAQDGTITMGEIKEEVSPDERWAVNPGEILTGYICWKDGKPIDSVHRNFMQLDEQGAFTSDDLTDHGPYSADMDGWKEESVLSLKSLGDGTELKFPTTSTGGRQAIQKVSDALMSN